MYADILRNDIAVPAIHFARRRAMLALSFMGAAYMRCTYNA
jgi:hypothetical protein